MMTELMKLFPKDKLPFRDNLIAFREEKVIRLANRIYLGTLIFSLMLVLLTLKRLPPQIPLYYSLPWGDEQLTTPLLLFLLPLGCLFFGFLNLFLAVLSFGSKPLAARILVWFNVVFTLLAALTLFRIIMLVI